MADWLSWLLRNGAWDDGSMWLDDAAWNDGEAWPAEAEQSNAWAALPDATATWEDA